MIYNIIPNPSFLLDLKALSKKYPSIKNDINEAVKELKIKPTIGIALGKDCFKIRVAVKSKRKGKSGGARLITCVKITKSIVYLLAVFDKAKIENISDTELAERLKEIQKR